MSPSSSLESLSVSFDRFVSFKYSCRFISDSGSSLLLYIFFYKKLSTSFKMSFWSVNMYPFDVSNLGMILLR